MRVLYLTLKKRWFDEIFAGRKKIEYREVKPYWTKRLFDGDGVERKFDVVEFRNGYARDARKMRVGFGGLRVGVLKKDVGDFKKGMKDYEILLLGRR